MFAIFISDIVLATNETKNLYVVVIWDNTTHVYITYVWNASFDLNT